jgi:hypothetical protein
MSNYKYKTPEFISSSFDEPSYLVTKISTQKKDGKKVKILKCPDERSGRTFEEIINEFISENINKFDIIDIKYAETSCLIIYKLI